MIIKSLKNYNPFYFLFAVILIIAFWSYYYFFSITDIRKFTTPELPIYQLLKTSVLNSSLTFLPYFISMILIVIQLFIVNMLNLKYSLSGNRNFFAVILFAFFSSLVLLSNFFSPVVIANIFILMALYRVFAAYNKEKVFSNFFDASLFISIASLFYFNAIFFIILLFVASLMMKTSPLKEWIIITIAILIIYAIYFEIYYIIFGNISTLFDKTFQTFDYANNHYFNDLQLMVTSISILLFTLITLFYFLRTNTGLNVSTRIFLRIIIIFFLLIASVFFLLKSHNYELILFCAFPLSALGSNYLMNSHSKKIPDIFFIIFVLTFIFLHIQNFFPALQQLNF